MSKATEGLTINQLAERNAEYVTTIESLRAQLTALTSQLESVVAENAVSNDRLQELIQIINNADNSYCICGDAMRNHAHGGCGHPTGMFDYHYSKWLESAKETPATDAFLAEVRASGVEMFGQYHNFSEKLFIQKEAKKFAAQLRQGVQS